MVLSVYPCNFISAKVPMMDVGMARAAMMVDRTLPRKSSTMMAANSAPRIKCSVTASVPVRTTAEPSRCTSSV